MPLSILKFYILFSLCKCHVYISWFLFVYLIFEVFKCVLKIKCDIMNVGSNVLLNLFSANVWILYSLIIDFMNICDIHVCLVCIYVDYLLLFIIIFSVIGCLFLRRYHFFSNQNYSIFCFYVILKSSMVYFNRSHFCVHKCRSLYVF